MAQLFTPPFQTTLDANANAVPGARLTFFLSETTTPATVYADAALTTPLASPVIADAAGRFVPIYLDPMLKYRVIVADASGTTIRDVDPINSSDLADLADGGGLGLVGFIADAFGAVPRTALSKARETVSPEDFGARGDGIEDDTEKLTAALNSGYSVRLTDNKTYLITAKIELTQPGVTISGGGKIKIGTWDFSSDTDEGGTHMRTFFVLAPNITFDGVTMDATGVTMGAGVENGFIWSRAPYTKVIGCQFVGMSKGTCVWSLGDAPYLSVTGCTSTNCSGLVFGRGRNGIANDNIVINATDAAIAINAQVCTGWVIADNTINNEALAIIPAMIAVEEGASGWIITGNNLYGANGGGINCINLLDETSVKGGIIANNYISAATFDGERPVTTNPAALLSVTASYRDVLISGNIIVGVPEGPSNSRAVVIPASGTVFENNVIDASMATGIDAIVDIIASNAGIVIRDNRVTGFAMARQFLINAGNYGDEPVRFIGGDFLVGTTAIDAELAWPSIMGLKLYIDNLKRVKDIAIPVQATSAIGDRATFLNLDCVYLPHKIDFFTEMACAFTTSTPGQTPVTPGALPWQNGDCFRNVDPAAQGALYIVRVAGGSEPDRWKRFGGPVT